MKAPTMKTLNFIPKESNLPDALYPSDSKDLICFFSDAESKRTAFRFLKIVLFSMLLLPFFSGCNYLENFGKKQETVIPKAKALDVDIMKPIKRIVTDYEEFTGETEAVDKVEIKAQVSGYLSRVAFKEGSPIAKGDLLFEIEPEVYQAVRDSSKAELESLQARLPRLENEVKRYQELVGTKAVSQSDYEATIADRNECRAKIDKAKAELQRAEIDLKYTRILSPIDGYISRKMVSEGNLIQPHSSSNSSLMALIVSSDPIYVTFSVNESAYLKLSHIFEEKYKADPQNYDQEQNIEFRLSDENSYLDKDGKPLHSGIIKYSDPFMDQSSGTVLLRATCRNPKRANGLPFFLPGLVVHVRIPVTKNYEALLIPEEAIGTEQGLRYVYIVDPSGKAQIRHLKLGPLQDDNMRVIRGGIREGEIVIVTGLLKLRPDLPVKPSEITLEKLREGF